MYKAIKVRIYPNPQQSQKLAQVMGAARWWWNYALNLCNETYKETGKGLTQIALNRVLSKLKMSEQTAWLKDCYSQVLQSTTLNLTKAFKNFFDKRARYPRFKSYHGKQFCQYPQNCQVVENGVKIPQVGVIKASMHRLFEGQLVSINCQKCHWMSGNGLVRVVERTMIEMRMPAEILEQKASDKYRSWEPGLLLKEGR